MSTWNSLNILTIENIRKPQKEPNGQVFELCLFHSKAILIKKRQIALKSVRDDCLFRR